MFQFAALAVASHLVFAAADGVPPLDIDAGCRAAESAALVIGRSSDNCRTDEGNARTELERTWNEFSAGDKSHCNSLIHTGGPASYVELLSCLEMSRDARRIAQDRAKAQGGRGTSPNATSGAGVDATGGPAIAR